MMTNSTHLRSLRLFFDFAKPILRICLFIIFITSSASLTISWNLTSILSLLCLLASYFLTGIWSKYKGPEKWALSDTFNTNPYKGKKGKGELDPEKENEYDVAIRDFILYEASATQSVRNFETMKNQSECIFAKRAKVLGSPYYQESISLEENIKSLYPTFLKFCFSFESLGLDAFIIELPGYLYGTDIQIFGEAMRRTLVTLKNCDNLRKRNKMNRLNSRLAEELPSASLSSHSTIHAENTNNWNSKQWVFEIHSTTFFITSFAPFYPQTNSRYNYGLEHCYILFQPEISFAINDLPPDTPVTNWVKPVTVRDKIRKAFYDKGRGYTPPLASGEPMVYDVVKRTEPEEDPVLWWKDASSQTIVDHKKYK